MSTLPVEQPTSPAAGSMDAERHSSTGISILIVGAGVGGVLTALESWRKEHEVRILERSSSPIETG
jgi:monoamine oxidase